MGETITVRKVSFGQGVERIFPLHAPVIDHIDMVRTGKVRRAKLYYLRDLKGKAADLKSAFRRDANGQSSSQQERSIRCRTTFEREARERGFRVIAGVDEVGRGCLFGPVFAAAVVLRSRQANSRLERFEDPRSRRARTAVALIKKYCLAWAIGGADVFEIDQINIYQASRLAMRRAVEALATVPDYLLIDAMKIDLAIEQLPLIDGDARCRAIAAASIVAKVHRDACMARWHEVFPVYNLASNKGLFDSGPSTCAARVWSHTAASLQL